MAREYLPRDCKLERYFAKHEFTTKYLLCCSDVEAFSMNDIIKMADPECKQLWDNLKLSYTESAGHPLLRQEVAKLHMVDADDVLIVTPQEGIYIAMHCLVDYFTRTFGDDRPRVISTYPAYQSLYENLRTLHCRVDYWTVKQSGGGWTFDLDDLKRLITKDTRLLVVNFPHNPTGYLPSEREWQQVLALCQQHNVFLFSDDMYRLSNNDGTAPLTDACAALTNAITLFGVSKTLALPGLRIGWLCTRNSALVESMKCFKDYITICSSAPSEILALIALRNRDRIVKRTLSIIEKNLDLLDDFFREYTDVFEWKRPKACITGLLKLKGWLLELERGGARGFCSRLQQEAGVLLLPSDVYDIADDCVRLGFGRSDLEQAVAALKAFLAKNKP